VKSSSQSQPGGETGPVARPAPDTEPSAQVDFHIISRFGTTIATAGDEDLAKATCRRLSARFDGLSVVRVETVVKKTTVFRSRLRRVK